MDRFLCVLLGYTGKVYVASLSSHTKTTTCPPPLDPLLMSVLHRLSDAYQPCLAPKKLDLSSRGNKGENWKEKCQGKQTGRKHGYLISVQVANPISFLITGFRLVSVATSILENITTSRYRQAGEVLPTSRSAARSFKR